MGIHEQPYALGSAMTNDAKNESAFPRKAAVFGASGGIGRALCNALLERGCEVVHAGSRSEERLAAKGIQSFVFDFADEPSIARAAKNMRDDPPELVIVATGVLTLADGTGPERALKRIDPQAMREVFTINTIGPALIAKHMLPILSRTSPFRFAALSARVGSISDNQLGGWYSYRASKAALNMLLKNFALEMGRTHPHGVVVGLHPGTVDSDLSKPFQAGLPEGQLTEPSVAARSLVEVIASLTPEDSGRVFDYAGREVPA